MARRDNAYQAQFEIGGGYRMSKNTNWGIHRTIRIKHPIYWTKQILCITFTFDNVNNSFSNQRHASDADDDVKFSTSVWTV